MMRLLGLYLLEDTSALFLRIGPPRYGRTTGPRGWEPSPPFRYNPFDSGGNLIGKAAFTQIEFAMDSPLEGTGFELSVPREIGFISGPCRSSGDLSSGELRAPISEAGCSTTDKPPHPV